MFFSADCGKNCVRCDGRKCLECDNGFARITITLRRFNYTICKPCAKQTSIKRKGVDKDDSKCAAGQNKPLAIISQEIVSVVGSVQCTQLRFQSRLFTVPYFSVGIRPKRTSLENPTE